MEIGLNLTQFLFVIVFLVSLLTFISSISLIVLVNILRELYRSRGE